MKRESWGTILTLATLVAVAMGCAPAAAPKEAAPAKPPEAPAVTKPVEKAAPTPKRGGIFYLAARQPAPHLSYWKEAGVSSNITLNPVYERLVALDYKPGEDYRATLRVVPALAEKWEQPDPTTYIFSIRKGVQWHDGTEFIAEDVAWAYKTLMDPKNAYRASANLASVEAITVMDKYTLRITTKGPSAIFLPYLADRYTVIQPRHVAERGDKFEEVAIGTGPFKLTSYDRQKGMTYVRNENYWRKGLPYVDGIKIIFGLDPSGMLAAFIAKQNDVLKVTDKPQFESLAKQVPNVQHEVFVRDIEDSIYLKLDRPPFNDPRVRQALHLAIDRKQLVDALTFGLGIANPPAAIGANTGWVIPQEELKTLPGWRQPKDQDLAEARRLLTEAGYGGGLKAVLRFKATHTNTPKEAEVLSQQFKKVGVEVELQPLEAAVSDKAIREGDYQMFVDTFTYFQPEREWRNMLHSKGALNKMPLNDPQLDALIEAQALELDMTKRQKLSIDIQRHMLKNLYIIPLITHVGFTAWHPYVHDWIDNYAGQAANMEWSILWMDPEQVPSGRSASW